MTRPLSRIRSTTSARPLGLGARPSRWPVLPLVASACVAIASYLPPSVLRPVEDEDFRLDELLLDDPLLPLPELAPRPAAGPPPPRPAPRPAARAPRREARAPRPVALPLRLDALFDFEELPLVLPPRLLPLDDDP